ncbi:Sin3 associated polypeptide p18-domain-containing protein [Cladochytrium replicatum]|nr:Sin3 associated polypeptide p18-domain-containing protein [Cladochytrium replicatum]
MDVDRDISIPRPRDDNDDASDDGKSAEGRIRGEKKQIDAPATLDDLSRKEHREKNSPFLIRTFWKQSSHHSPDSFTPDKVPDNELHLYAWKDATLRELVSLLSPSIPDVHKPTARIQFRVICHDQVHQTERNRLFSKEIGTVSNYPRGRSAFDENKTLADVRFVVGDFLSIAVNTEESFGSGFVGAAAAAGASAPVSGGPVRRQLAGLGIVGSAARRAGPYSRPLGSEREVRVVGREVREVGRSMGRERGAGGKEWDRDKVGAGKEWDREKIGKPDRSSRKW